MTKGQSRLAKGNNIDNAIATFDSKFVHDERQLLVMASPTAPNLKYTCVCGYYEITEKEKDMLHNFTVKVNVYRQQGIGRDRELLKHPAMHGT